MACLIPGCREPSKDDDLCAKHLRMEQNAIGQVDFVTDREKDEYYGHPYGGARPRSAEIPKIPEEVESTVYGTSSLRYIIARFNDDSQSGYGRNNALFKAGCQVGELIAGEQIEYHHGFRALVDAAEAVIPDEKFKSRHTIKKSISIGMQNPRVPK